MLSDEKLWERCKNGEKIAYEDLGLSKWIEKTDDSYIECGGYTIYKTPEGYRHCSGRFVTPFERWLYGLK